MLSDFIESNMKNVEPKSTKRDEPILEIVEPNPSGSLSYHFYPPRAPEDLVLTFLLSLCDVKFELNLDFIDILPKFASIEDPYLFIHEF